MAGFKIAEAFVEIEGDKGKFSGTIRGAKRETADFARAARKSLKVVSIGLAAIAAAAAVAATVIAVKLTKAIIRAAAAAVATAVKYDKLKIGLIAVTGSAEEAARQLTRLRTLALAPGLGFEQAIQGSTALQAAGISAELAERSLSAFGNALAVAGKGAESLGRVNLQLSQIAAKASGFGADIRVLREAVPSLGPIIANAFDGKALEDITISGKELLKVLVSGLEGLGQAGESVGNNLVNLGVSFDLLKNEIGKTLLSITSDTTKSLTGIIDTIVELIPQWKFYQDQVGDVFGNIIVIAAESTARMLKSITTIVIALAPLVWKPLLLAFRNVGLEIDALSSRIGASVLKSLGIISESTFEQDMKAIADRNRKLFDEMATDFGVSFNKSLAEVLKKIEAERPAFKAALSGLLSGVQLELNKLKTTIPEAIAEPAKKAIDKIDTSNFLGNMKALGIIFDKNKEALKAFGNVALIHTGNLIKLGIEGKEAAVKIGDHFRAVTEAMQEQAQRVADTIAPAFENMFTSFFQGNTKSLWENFFADLKRIAIRQLASVFATQLITGLLTGGVGFAGIGGGSLLAGLGPIAAPGGQPRAAASGIARGARAVGGFLEGGTINIFDQNLENFDQQRLTKHVEQGIAPALAIASADGIQ